MVDFGIWYYKGDGKFEGYVDSDWANSIDDSKSTTGFVFSLGNGVFTWNSKKQGVVAQSSAKAEYIAATTVSNQAIWIRKVLTDLNHVQEESIVVYMIES